MMQKGNPGWRYSFQRARTVVGTGISFVFFMGWGFLLGVVLFPAIRLFKGAKARTVFHGQMRLAWRFFIGVMRVTGSFGSIRVEGVENLPQGKPCLLIANHLTLVDIVVLGARVPDFNCVVKMSLWNHVFFGTVVKACDFIPNLGSEGFIEQCKRGFSENRPLIIFPQGERTLPHVPMKFQRGAAQIAVRTGVAVHPVIFNCNPVTLTKGTPWYKVPASPKLSVRIEPELSLPPEVSNVSSIPQKVRAVTKYWEEYFTAAFKIGNK